MDAPDEEIHVSPVIGPVVCSIACISRAPDLRQQETHWHWLDLEDLGMNSTIEMHCLINDINHHVAD